DLAATRLADADVFHHSSGLDLADARQPLEQREHLALPDGFVLVGELEQLGEREGAHLQPFLDLGAGSACGGGLLEGGLSLFVREGRGIRHGPDPTVASSRTGGTERPVFGHFFECASSCCRTRHAWRGDRVPGGGVCAGGVSGSGHSPPPASFPGPTFCCCGSTQPSSVSTGSPVY